MKTWDYVINSNHKTANIILSKVPVWSHVLDIAVETFCSYIPSWMPIVPFPVRLSKEDAEKYNDSKRWAWSHKWYGNFSSVFCGFVHNPVLRFCHRRTKEKIIPIGYEEAKNLFYYEDQKFWDEEEKFKLSRFDEEE